MAAESLTRRAVTRLLAAAGLAPAAATAAGGPYEALLESDVGVMTRDGVRLATDVYRPARGGKPALGRVPTIMERTPYGRTVTSFRDIPAASDQPLTRAQLAQVYVRAGYVVVFQDCRSR